MRAKGYIKNLDEGIAWVDKAFGRERCMGSHINLFLGSQCSPVLLLTESLFRHRRLLLVTIILDATKTFPRIVAWRSH